MAGIERKRFNRPDETYELAHTIREAVDEYIADSTVDVQAALEETFGTLLGL